MAYKTVDEYIQNQPSPQKEICETLRKIILDNCPGIEERMWVGVPYYGNKYYIVSLKDHVNIGFSIEGMHKKYIDMLTGGGKTFKVLEFTNVDEIDEDKIVDMLKRVK
jgi:hypothetical protein